MDVGFIGLGMMGRAMARNIAKAGHHVRAWNRSAVPDAAADGLDMVLSPRDALQADVIFTMLSDDAAIRTVLFSPDALRAARPGAVHVVTATISVDFAEELRARHAEAGLGYVSAPVFGRPDVAAAAQLTIVAAGEAAALDRAQPLFDLIGRKTWRLGEDPRQANAVKLAGNMMIGMAVEAMAEATVLTGSYGVSPQAFFDVVIGPLFAGRSYESYSAKIASGDFAPGFKMKLGLKDLRLAAAAGEKSGRQFPQLDAVRTRMAQAVEAGLGEEDWSAVAEFAKRSG